MADNIAVVVDPIDVGERRVREGERREMAATQHIPMTYSGRVDITPRNLAEFVDRTGVGVS
jgi:hypothetical protein